MSAKLCFGLAAGALGLALALVEIGVERMISEKSDESWQKVTVTDGASALSD
jgi:hypothetical protein